MITAEMYDPAQWSDFFLLVGTGSAALAGLVFVAMTINLKGLAKDATHRYRAINMLTGFTSVFIICSFSLMGGQSYRMLGLEWLIVSSFATVINTNGYIQAFKLHSSLYALSLFRIVGGSVCYVGQIIGALLMLSGHSAGIYISAVSMVANFYFFVSGSWLLIVGTLHKANDAQL